MAGREELGGRACNGGRGGIGACYGALVTSFQGDDERLLESLPPNALGAAEYRTAIRGLHALGERTPRSLNDVTEMAAAGRRLQRMRDKVGAEAVPEELQAQWLALHRDGLPLADMSPKFTAWLDERGLSRRVVAVYRTR